MIRPLRDMVLIEKLDQERETVTAGGIVLPATLQAKAKTKQDTFHAKVLAKGPKVPAELGVGDEIIVETWADGDGTKLFTGEGVGGHRFFITPNDIVCVVDRPVPPMVAGEL